MIKQKNKKILSVIMSIVMLFSILPFNAFANHQIVEDNKTTVTTPPENTAQTGLKF